MKVILLENIKGVGKKDEIINASDGYAHNFLLPRKLAVEANAGNLSNLKAKKDSNQHRYDLEKQEAVKIKEELKNIILEITVKAGENGKIFGGVTAKEICENLDTQYHIKIDKKKVDLKETIKTLGTVLVDIKLFEGVTAQLKVKVTA